MPKAGIQFSNKDELTCKKDSAILLYMGYTTGEHHNLRKHPLYAVWFNMKQRCYNPNATQYKWYGGKGIEVCEEWRKSFKCFYDWANATKWSKGMSIERVDINGNYCPDNCTIIPIKQQARNRKTTLWVKYKGERMSLAECVERFSDISYKVVWQRIFINGYNLEDALTKPKWSKK